MFLLLKLNLLFLNAPWHWSVSGVALAFVMFLLIYSGEKFGVSTSYKAICSMAGAGKSVSYFNYDWKSHSWLLMFIVGTIIGGGIATSFMDNPLPIAIASSTASDLHALGIMAPDGVSVKGNFLPEELFNFSSLFTLKGIILLIGGGFLVGFGTRYAGGCTSGHAITGLSNLQLPSLVAVVGFFIGGLLITHLLLPLILSL